MSIPQCKKSYHVYVRTGSPWFKERQDLNPEHPGGVIEEVGAIKTPSDRADGVMILLFSLDLKPVVRGFLRDRDIMRMTLFHSRRRDFDESGVSLQFRDVFRAAITHS